MRFLDIWVFFRLEIGQISFDLVKNAFTAWQLVLLGPSIAICNTLARVCAEIKILKFFWICFWWRKWPTSLGFSIFLIFSFALPFSTLLFFWLQWLTFYWACLQLKKLSRKRHQDRQFLPWRSHVQWQEVLHWFFHSTFWAFLCISQAPLVLLQWFG